MKKTKTFTVELPREKFSGKFAHRVISEANKQNEELEYTYRVNNETTDIHREILVNLIKEIEKELEFAGIEFQEELEHFEVENRYSYYVAKIRINNKLIRLRVVGISESLPETRYTTYYGKWAISYKYYGCNFRNVDGVESFLKILENDIIKEYKKTIEK